METHSKRTQKNTFYYGNIVFHRINGNIIIKWVLCKRLRQLQICSMWREIPVKTKCSKIGVHTMHHAHCRSRRWRSPGCQSPHVNRLWHGKKCTSMKYTCRYQIQTSVQLRWIGVLTNQLWEFFHFNVLKMIFHYGLIHQLHSCYRMRILLQTVEIANILCVRVSLLLLIALIII